MSMKCLSLSHSGEKEELEMKLKVTAQLDANVGVLGAWKAGEASLGCAGG